MATQDFKRKLAAILHADVKGYSHLMGEDEEATVSTLTAYREIMGVIIQKHRGRVVHGSGDSLLAEFVSVVDAVQCAVEIQKDLETRNAELSEDRKVEFRIGINLGDVIDKDEDLHGDGVNIAARIEGLAEGGGICISRTAFDQVRNKLKLGYEYIGEHSVKNIAQPVRVYRVLTEPEAAGKVLGEKMTPLKQRWKLALAAVVFVIIGAIGVTLWNTYFRPLSVEVASVEKMAFPLPDKPSIAVLPFDNMSGDPEQEYLADGISENIISALSKVSKLFVIDRNSTFTYKGKPVKVRQVSEDLGVRYVVEGSVQRSGKRLRVTSQLIDAITGNHLWSDRYDRDLKDIFALQDEITLKILAALQVKLTHGEQAHMWAKGTKNLDAYLKLLQAREYYLKMNVESNALARKMAEEAIALDSEYADAYSWLGATHLLDVFLGSTKTPKDSIAKAIELTQKALALDDSLAVARSRLGFLYTMIRQHEKGVAEAERGVVLNPNSAGAYDYLGFALRFAGRPEEAIPMIKKAIRLNPYPPGAAFFNLGMAYLYTGKCEEAISECEKALQRETDNLLAHITATAAYSMCGREEEARKTAAGVLRIDPKFTTKYFAKKLPYKNQSDTDKYTAALRKAGLPDTPPLPLPDKPSIAVLAFDNLSGDPKQEYFGDGIAEEIITALSKTEKLFVIARSSTFTYKEKPVKVQQVGRELGVKYVLEGSVRKDENRLRITAQLIDASTGHHLWAESYDRDLKDLFEVQDEITMKIVTALQIKLTEGESARIWAKKAENLDVYKKQMEALSAWNKGTKEGHIRHGQLAQEVIDMAPELAIGYRLRTWYYWELVTSGISPRENTAKAFKLAQKSLSMDENDSMAHAVLGGVYLAMRQYEKAIAEGKRAVELNPNGAFEHGLLGGTLSYAGRPDEAIDHIKQGIRLNPFPEYWYYLHLGRCYRQKGMYDKALTEFKKAHHLSPDSPPLNFALALAYSLLGRDEEAHAAVEKGLEINPKISSELIAKISMYKNKEDTQQIIDALRKAGLPEKPPQALQNKPSKKEMPDTETSSISDVVYDLNGEWDAIYDSKGLGVTRDVVKITQKGNKFVGIKLIGSEWVPKGSETIKGELGRNGFKSIYFKNVQGWAPAEWQINKQGNEIVLKQHMASYNLIIDVKLTRK